MPSCTKYCFAVSEPPQTSPRSPPFHHSTFVSALCAAYTTLVYQFAYSIPTQPLGLFFSIITSGKPFLASMRRSNTPSIDCYNTKWFTFIIFITTATLNLFVWLLNNWMIIYESKLCVSLFGLHSMPITWHCARNRISLTYILNKGWMNGIGKQKSETVHEN